MKTTHTQSPYGRACQRFAPDCLTLFGNRALAPGVANALRARSAGRPGTTRGEPPATRRYLGIGYSPTYRLSLGIVGTYKQHKYPYITPKTVRYGRANRARSPTHGRPNRRKRRRP